MLDLEVIDDPAVAITALDPLRAQLLAGCTSRRRPRRSPPGRLTRQKVNYHLRLLEEHGLVRQVDERKRGGLDRAPVLVATAASYVVSPAAMAEADEPPRAHRRPALGPLPLAVAARAVREVGELVRGADDAGQPLADARDRQRDALPLGGRAGGLHPGADRAVAALVARYHDGHADDGRWHRLVVAAHPIAHRPPVRTEEPMTPHARRATSEPTFRRAAPSTSRPRCPGTPEQVWEAIATGAGITAWFVPTEIEGERMTFDHGLRPGHDRRRARVTASEPPQPVRATSRPATRSRLLAYEFLVEAQDGGACVVRLVNSGFGTGEDWDEQYDGMAEGWRPSWCNLGLYLTHFAGEVGASITPFGQVPDGAGMSTGKGRAVLYEALAVREHPAEGDRVTIGTVDEGPYVVGRVVHVQDELVLVVTDEPGRGYAVIGAEAYPTGVAVGTYLYLFGPGAEARRDELAPRWHGWMADRFPLPEGEPDDPPATAGGRGRRAASTTGEEGRWPS